MKVRKTKNFVDLNIDYFIKLGGSLITDIDKAKELSEGIARFSRKKRIVIFPGGGPIDNYIENFNRKFELKEITHHQACARAQDQTGLLFANFNLDCYETTEHLAGVREILGKGKIPIILPSKLISYIDPFEKTWDISSDSMGAYFSYLVEAKNYVILTDVDGIYTADPKKEQNYQLIKQISVNELSKMGHTSVDITLSDFIANSNINCWIMNGYNIDNLVKFLNGDISQVTGSFITGNSSF